MHALLRWVVFALVKLYYPRRTVEGLERLPSGPAIFVANHPNGLLDPMVLQLALGRPVSFLAKSTFFTNPIGAFAMRAFQALPVFRPRDGADTQQNEKTFALCRERLSGGGDLALFPEGTSHSDPRLKPLKTGAARIALSAELPSVPLVPVGLDYNDKTTFRSPVHVIVGQPLDAATYRDAYRDDSDATVRQLTSDLGAALAGVVTQAETRELKDGIRALATLTASSPNEAHDPGARQRRAQALLRAYDALRARDPAELRDLEREARRYLRAVTTLGITDPWALENPTTARTKGLLRVVALLVMAPFALVGAVLGFLPYRLAGIVAQRVSDEEDLHGTLKLLAGLLCLGVSWMVWVGLAAWFAGLAGAALMLVSAPLTGYAALRFGERFATLRQALRYLVITTRHRDLTQALRARRQALAVRIEQVLAEHVAKGGTV